MAQDFRAIISHSLTAADLPRLPDRLNKLVVDSRWSHPWKWDIGDDVPLECALQNCQIDLSGPTGIFLKVRKHCCVIATWNRWKAFLMDKKIRDAQRREIYDITSEFCSRRAIYLPDSGGGDEGRALDWFYESNTATFDELEARLRSFAGPPARLEDLVIQQAHPPAHYKPGFMQSVLGELAGPFYDFRNGYLLDDFADMV